MVSAKSRERILFETKKFYDILAKRYDKVAGYRDMESEKVRNSLKAQFQSIFKGLCVLEIACGTGYWTKVVSKTAASVLATDISPQMIKLAKDRCCDISNVQFRIVDAYELKGIKEEFTAGFSHWWWSHVPRYYLSKFIKAFHKNLQEGAIVLHADHLRNESTNWHVNDYGDRVEDRQLFDGNIYTVIKNFPSFDEIKETLQPFSTNIRYQAQENKNMWTVTYRVKH